MYIHDQAQCKKQLDADVKYAGSAVAQFAKCALDHRLNALCETQAAV